MPKYIDVEELLRKPPDIHDYYDESGDRDSSHGYSVATIKAAPTISPDEVRGVGEWEIDEQEVGGIFGGRQIVKIPCCSNCGTHNEWKTNYCPSCGARMKGAEDNASP